MKGKEVQIKRFVQAIGCLTPRLQNIALHLSESQQATCEELHLRAGHPLHIQVDGAERRSRPRSSKPKNCARLSVALLGIRYIAT